MHKNKLRLTDRMQVIADLVGEGEVVADIGTDHGYIPLWLLINGRCSDVILADVNQGPLDRAAANAAVYLGADFAGGADGIYDTDAADGSVVTEDNAHAAAKLDMRLGSGIEVLEKGEADTVIIAGMGGLLIRDILSHDIEKTRSLKKLILQPRNNSRELRGWMRSELREFTIIKERVVKEGKKYSEILCAVRNEYVTDEDASRISRAADIKASLDISDDISLEIPCMYLADADNDADDTVREYIEKRVQVEERIIDSIKQSGRNESSERQLALTEKRLEEIKKMADLCGQQILKQ